MPKVRQKNSYIPLYQVNQRTWKQITNSSIKGEGGMIP